MLIRIFKWLRKPVYLVVLFLLICTAIVVGISAFNLPNGTKIYTVLSGSMSPSIPTGSLVLVKPSSSYKLGDVITFKAESDRGNNSPKHITTHRIDKVDETKDGIRYETKGDANSNSDYNQVDQDLVIGRVIFAVPFLGYTTSFAKTQTGFILLIVIPATIIIYSELMSVKNEALRLMGERKRRKLSLKEKVEEKVGEEIIVVEKEAKKVEKTVEKDIKKLIK